MDQQAAKHVARAKYGANNSAKLEARDLNRKLKDPLLLSALNLIERDKNAAGYLQLYQYAIEGKLQDYETVNQICQVLGDHIRRASSDNPNAKYGIRYPTQMLNFMVLLRSYGAKSASQYGILTSQIPGPSPRHIRYNISSGGPNFQLTLFN